MLYSLTRNVRIQHKDHNRPTLQVDSQNFTLQDEVIYRQVSNSIVLGIAATLLFISVRFFLPILGVILLKLKQASNVPVYFSFETGQTSSNNFQQVAPTRNMVCKRSQHVGPNNVASCWPTMLRAFARAFPLYHKNAPVSHFNTRCKFVKLENYTT